MTKDLPLCNLNTCKQYFDGYCTDLVRKESCPYAIQCDKWKNARKEIENLNSDYVSGSAGFQGAIVQTKLTLLNDVLKIMNKYDLI